eukprot:2218650-Lingulodinium_polyedra.AAC.1
MVAVAVGVVLLLWLLVWLLVADAVVAGDGGDGVAGAVPDDVMDAVDAFCSFFSPGCIAMLPKVPWSCSPLHSMRLLPLH